MAKHIHVLEDDIYIAEALEIILVEAGYNVSLYHTIAAFAASLKLKHPDLMILDINLPDGNGRDVCQKIKLDEQTKHIPVIMMSAHAQPSHTIKEGCEDEFLSKPFDIPVLLGAIEKLI